MASAPTNDRILRLLEEIKAQLDDLSRRLDRR
jgi:hypothetical protein